MIDAHHHLWKYSAAEYGWIGPQMPALRKDFLPEELEKVMHHFGIEGTVAVQARQSLEETSWQPELAGKHPLIRGVVGWVPLTEGDAVKRHLARFAPNPNLRGATLSRTRATRATSCAVTSTPASTRCSITNSVTTS